MENHINGTSVSLIKKWVTEIESLITPHGEKLYSQTNRLREEQRIPIEIITKLEFLQTIMAHTDDSFKQDRKKLVYEASSTSGIRYESSRVSNYIKKWKSLID